MKVILDIPVEKFKNQNAKIKMTMQNPKWEILNPKSETKSQIIKEAG